MRGAPVAGDVITTGTRAADATPVDAQRDSDPAGDAQPAQVAEAADVPSRGMASSTSDLAPEAPDPETPDVPAPETPASGTAQEAAAPQTPPSDSAAPEKTLAPDVPVPDAPGPEGKAAPARSSRSERYGRAGIDRAVATAPPADVAAPGVGVRRRLARLGAPRGAHLRSSP